MPGTSPPLPNTSDILKQVRVIERILIKASESSALAAAVRPFLATVRNYLTQDAPLKRVEAKLDKLSAAIA